MKKYLSIIGLLFIVTSSFKSANELKWNDFDSGYKLAKKKKKLMLVDVYTDWCGWCKVMDRETYAKDNIIAAIEKDYIAIKFNPEIQNVKYTYEGKTYTGQELAGAISNNQLRGYPTTVFINPANKKVTVIAGYKNPQEFIQLLNTIKTDLK